MALKDTVKHLKDLLLQVAADVEKAVNGNKAASQRVRTGTIRLEKVAKVYRKESISTERKTKGTKKKPAAKKKAAPKAKAKSASKSKSKGKAHKMAHRSGAKRKGAMKAKATRARSAVKMMAKRPTAKLPRP